MEKMAEFISSPNLPRNVHRVLIGESYLSALQKPLEAFGIEVLSIPSNPRVDQRLSCHADLSVFHAGNNELFTAAHMKSSEFVEKLAKLGFNVHFCAENQSECYPNDANLNICCVGKNFIFNPKVSDKVIISYLTEQGRVPIHCRQGYCKCSVCVVDDNSIICADKGIIAAATAAGLDVLEIQTGHIILEGYDYGFIGGAAIKISSDKMAFTGTLDIHPDKRKILDYLEIRGIEPVYLTETPAFDIGSAVVLTEKEPKN